MFYGKRIGVHFTLLGPAPIQGDVDNKIAQVSIGDAKDRLVEAYTDGIFQVYFMPDPVSVSLYAYISERQIVKRSQSHFLSSCGI